MFQKFIINFETNIFEQLLNSAEFEDICNGRKGANLIDYKNDLIPIVRTTTTYNKPLQKFLPIHYNIINSIKKVSKTDNLELNNAMIEIYDHQYRKMKFHSDQALDLADDSYICIFSYYDNPYNSRKLKIKDKISGKTSEILLEHSSVVIFSTETNKNFVHCITLDSVEPKNKWLGITFRLSKTFIKFNKEIPYFASNNKILRLASDDEKKEFMKYKGLENTQIGFSYPDLDYAIDVSSIKVNSRS